MDERDEDSSPSNEEIRTTSTGGGSLARSLFMRSQPLPTLSEENRGNEDAEDEENAATSGPESPMREPVVVNEIEKEGYEEREGTTFDAMLRSVRTDISLLVLTTAELTPTKLSLVRDALHESAPVHINHQQDDEEAPPPNTANTDVDRLRAMVSVDVLRLLVERFQLHEVKHAIEEAARAIFSSTAVSTGMTALAKAPAVITSHNISRVVLTARQQLMEQAGHRDPVHSSALNTSKPRLELVFPTQILHATPTSPSMRSMASSFHSSTTGPTRRPVSILAKEGDHLLLQEQLTRFEHRVHSPVKGSVLRVRRDGADAADAAAKRRSRALEYAATRQRPLASQT